MQTSAPIRWPIQRISQAAQFLDVRLFGNDLFGLGQILRLIASIKRYHIVTIASLVIKRIATPIRMPMMGPPGENPARSQTRPPVRQARSGHRCARACRQPPGPPNRFHALCELEPGYRFVAQKADNRGGHPTQVLQWLRIKQFLEGFPKNQRSTDRDREDNQNTGNIFGAS